MVFQNYALYPHMSVYNNLSFGLRCCVTVEELMHSWFEQGDLVNLAGRAAELNSAAGSGIDQQVRQTARAIGH